VRLLLDKNSTPVTSAAAVVNPQTTYQDQVVELEGDTYYESSFSEDDYYDYSYAARIKRFHDPLEGVGYYDSYYTNRYWYDYDPYSYGTSIYIGYDYAYPYYRPSVSFGFSWGLGLGLSLLWLGLGLSLLWRLGLGISLLWLGLGLGRWLLGRL
jgi:hypothetical protein